MDWKIITASVLANRKIQYLSLAGGGFLSNDAAAHIKNLLSDKQCEIRLLTLCLQDCIYHEEDDDEEDDVAHCVE